MQSVILSGSVNPPKLPDKYCQVCYIILSLFHLEMRACDWPKSRHVTDPKSQYCPHETLLPS